MKYFGTDGIRGIPNEKLTVDLVTKLGMALTALNNKNVVLATDTRLSKDMLAQAISAGALSKGLNVEFLGIIPTPALIYYSYVHKATGIMITASHNPYTDNGIKVLKNGIKLSEEDELKIESLIDNPKEDKTEIGKYIINDNAKEEYVDFIKKHIIKTNLKIVLDTANGATYKTAEMIFNDITSNLTIIANNPDGYNINNGCGSTHLELLKKKVLEIKADIGFAFDGDGDRVLAVDKNGNIIDGDMLIYILARYLKQNNKLNNNSIALSMMSNLGLIKSLNEYGINVIETNVGDKYIVKALFENHLSVGGENSGHIILPDLFHTGDGVFVASQIIKILEETNTSIDDWLKDVKMYADKMVNIKVNDKKAVLNNQKLFDTVEEIKKELKNDCKIIIRASGTEDLIRVSVMAQNEADVLKYSECLVNLVKSI
ncbi:MAG: phosphoglucosamine mutase [Acholeplasmatales bacterium]|nr:phosphoglucosamine mutase [Acholeplasmatales bacterium]